MPPIPGAGKGRASGDGLVLHMRGHKGSAQFSPVPVETPSPVEFELDNFKGICMFLHRPAWSYDNPDTEISYPYKQLFHGRRRLWEWRLQGKFKQRPGQLYVGIELEDYVPVNFATRSLMRGILPLIQSAIQCKLVHHEIGDPDDASVHPAVVAPIWAVDNTLVHDDPKDAPDIQNPTALPGGLNRKGARQYWETLWKGGGPQWDDGLGGPTFTFAFWGPSQLLDMRAWVFRKLPMMWGRQLSMEPFCGQQPVHAVIYELADGEPAPRHRQEEKLYSVDMRLMPEAVWEQEAMGKDRSPHSAPSLGIAEHAVAIAEGLREKLPLDALDDSDEEDFCSAHSGDSSPEVEKSAEKGLLQVDPDGSEQGNAAHLPQPLVRQRRSRLPGFLRCCKRRSSSRRQWEQLPV